MIIQTIQISVFLCSVCVRFVFFLACAQFLIYFWSVK
jgi:hypothetical protein